MILTKTAPPKHILKEDLTTENQTQQMQKKKETQIIDI